MKQDLLDAIRARAGGRCEARIECRGAPDVLSHHRRRAGRIDSFENLMRLCNSCHLHIHANPAKSYVLGLLVHSWDDPTTVPVRSPLAAT